MSLSPPHSQRSSKSAMNNTIDDLTDVVLVEILCRLPCFKYAFQCKCVSKRWYTLISDSYFVGRYICLQSEYHEQTPITLINRKGKEFLHRMSNPLHPFLKSLENLHGLEEPPVVVGTYNDLLLCCVGEYYQRSYYICNPHTQQLIDLPPPPPCHQEIKPLPEGFMCDLPYYKCMKGDTQGRTVQFNTEYRCRVVRLISGGHGKSSKFKVQIFSSETGEWRESIVSSPTDINLDHIDCHTCYANASNRMLYWMSTYADLLLGFDPFLINNYIKTGSTDGKDIIDHGYKCRLVDISANDNPDSLSISCLGACGGCLKIYAYDYHTNALLVLNLNGDGEIHGGFENFFLEHSKRYSLGIESPDEYTTVERLILDPSNEEIMYLSIDGENIMFNLRTRTWLKTDDKIIMKNLSSYHFQCVIPWWPTPVPTPASQRARRPFEMQWEEMWSPSRQRQGIAEPSIWRRMSLICQLQKKVRNENRSPLC